MNNVTIDITYIKKLDIFKLKVKCMGKVHLENKGTLIQSKEATQPYGMMQFRPNSKHY